ncbi:MAG: hypothetical protein HC927_08970 [Deltaproteobacteria bacterium]|nr:hypothetical protein [Deltaproteobacteria bacterium]
MLRARWCTPILLILALGCQESSRIPELVDEYGEIRRSVVLGLCTCPEAFGFADDDACEEGMGDVSGDTRDCILDAFEGYKDGEDYFECVNPVFDAYNGCLSGDSYCAEDGSGFATCIQERDDRLTELCPGLPTEVRSAFVSCLPDVPAAMAV